MEKAPREAGPGLLFVVLFRICGIKARSLSFCVSAAC